MYNVNAGEAECLYDNLKEGEHVTTSLIVLDGEELKARMSLQGPLGKPGTASATEVIAAAMRYDKTKDDRLELYDPHTINFEELYDEYGDDDFDDGDMDDYSGDDDVDDLVFRDYYYDFDDDDEYEFYEDDEMDEADRAELREAKAKREAMSTEEKQKMKKQRQQTRMEEMQAMMKKRNEGKKKKEKRKTQASDRPTQHEMMMDRLLDGGSFEKTVQIQESGWYRFCVMATDSDVSSFVPSAGYSLHLTTWYIILFQRLLIPFICPCVLIKDRNGIRNEKIIRCGKTQ